MRMKQKEKNIYAGFATGTKKARTWRAYSAKGGLSVAAELLRLAQHDASSHMKHMHFFF